MTLARRLLMTTIALAITAVAIAAATWSSFSATTANPSNMVSAGTVNIADNDGDATFSVPGMVPGTSVSGCIRVTYTGSLQSNVHMYGSFGGSLAPFLNLTITRGGESAPAFPACTSFTPDATNYIGAGAGVVYSGTAAAFDSAHSNYSNGLVDVPGSPQAWNTNSAHSYEFTFTLPSGVSSAAQGLSTTATLDWEAQNT
jgi:hypothetical protein